VISTTGGGRFQVTTVGEEAGIRAWKACAQRTSSCVLALRLHRRNVVSLPKRNTLAVAEDLPCGNLRSDRERAARAWPATMWLSRRHDKRGICAGEAGTEKVPARAEVQAVQRSESWETGEAAARFPRRGGRPGLPEKEIPDEAGRGRREEHPERRDRSGR
jgi:hypothetical protein